MRPAFIEYLGFLFQPFFRWWWAAVTGFASIFGVLVTPQSGFALKPPVVASLTFCSMTMAFLTLSTLTQGWKLYRKRFAELRVSTLQKTRDYGGDYVAMLCGDMDIPAGTLMELRRPMGEADTLFALVEIRNRAMQGNYLCVPVWTSPGQQRDLSGGKFLVSDLLVVPYVQRDTLGRIQPNA